MLCMGIYKFNNLPDLKRNQCVIILEDNWVVFQVNGGLEFKKAWKRIHGSWPKGKWPNYAETLRDCG